MATSVFEQLHSIQGGNFLKDTLKIHSTNKGYNEPQIQLDSVYKFLVPQFLGKISNISILGATDDIKKAFSMSILMRIGKILK